MTETGRRFGHYTLLGRLGAGGMGEVSLARDDRLGREVAIKMLPRRLAQDAESLMRFRREALTLASLNHPNIAVIHGFEEDEGGALALVLERVEGESLGERLSGGPLPAAEAMQICVQIAEALEVAHERGIVHRDLKPSNVMLAPRGLVKVLDFGLARRIGEGAPTVGIPLPPPPALTADDAATLAMPGPGGAEDAPTIAMPAPPTADDAATLAMPGPDGAEDAPTIAMPALPAADDAATLAMPGPGTDFGSGAPHTTLGVVTGTPGYMSPEQVRGEEQDHRTDIFAFGCVLYECLTGARAVQGRTIFELMEHALDREVDLDALPERLPAPVRGLLARCLEKDRTRRLGEIREARYALEDVLGIRRAAALRAGEVAVVPNNLPAAVTSFVGRERELAECARQLEATRWLTLVGMGGSGKTRLARRLAEQSLESFADGVWFVDLTALKHQERVPESLADAAGIQQEPGVSIMRTLTRAFAERRVLIVLDNCEEVLEPVDRLGAELLSACPSLKLLATSRESVGAAGEVVVAVAPLALPSADEAFDEAALAASEAVRLFVDRAGASKPGFALGAANVQAVAEICRRLDGIPLAIELAAARVRMLSVEEILARLGDRFRLLTAGGRGVPERHQTLRATIQWSADHLSDDERELFVRLGVFVGAWSLESALAVTGGRRDEFEVLDALTRLVDRSLVVVAPAVAGETRYRYLETVRTFALERLVEAGEESAAHDRHLDYFLGVAEESQTRLAGADQKRWLARLDVEHSDLLAAHAWCGSDDARAVPGLRLAGAMWRYWSARGHYAVAGRIMSEALVRPGAAAPGTARATALVRAGGNAITRGDYAFARPLVEESLAISRELGDRVGVARSLGTLATIAIFQEDLDEARNRSTECLAVYRELGRPAGVAVSLHTLGYVALYKGEISEARARYDEALEALSGTGDERLLAHTLSDSARVDTRMGELRAARIQFATALQLVRGLGVQREAAYALEGVAELAALSDRPDVSIRLLGAARGLREAVGSPPTAVESKELAALLDRTRMVLDAQAFQVFLAQGRALASGAAIRVALEWLEEGEGATEGRR